MSKPHTDNPLLTDLIKCNEALSEKLHRMRTYIDSAESNGLLGDGDPLLMTFRRSLSIHEKKVEQYCTIDVKKFDAAPEGTISLERALGSLFRLMGFKADSMKERLKEEIRWRTIECHEMEDSFQSIKRKTETSEKYEEFYDSLPKGKNLIANEAESDIVTKISSMNPSIGARSRYMESQLSSESMALIPQASIAHEFDALRMEVDYLCLSSWSGGVNELMKQIFQELAGMARRFAVVINRYYAGELGKGFAELANTRFRASYFLIQGVSSLYRGYIVNERPLVTILRRSEFACNPRMLTLNLQSINSTSVQRRFTSIAYAQNLRSIMAMCLEFRENTQEVLQRMAFSTETIQLALCANDPDKSLGLPADVIAMLEQDEDDIEFLQNAHEIISLKTVSPGGPDLEVEADEIIPTLKSFGLREMQVPFNDSEQIGRGSFATVREVPWDHSNLWVAIKCYKIIPNEQRSIKRLVREAQIMSELRHRNILSVFGYARLPSHSDEETQENDSDADFITYALVYPVYKKGSLIDYMKSSKSLSECTKAKILLDIATALTYLHDPSKEIGVVVHGDVRAANVLIAPTGRALLCDFGLSRHANMDEKWQTLSMYTNPAWMAFELFNIVPSGETVEPQKQTAKTDIYAFGCVCYEVVHEKTPYRECAADYFQIAARKAHGISPVVDIPTSYRARNELRQLMEMCWRIRPARRPPASRLELILKGIVNALL